MNSKNLLFFISILLLVQMSCYGAATSADFYVSPSGNDNWSGTLANANNDNTDGPFKTLAKARDAVRQELKKTKKDVTVMLGGGTYCLQETVVFGLEDSGLEGRRITYCNYPNEKPIITSAVEITGFSKLQADIEGLTPKAKGHIWVAQILKDVKPFLTLYQNDKRLPRARSKGFSALREVNDPNNSTQLLYYPKGVDLKNWDNIADVEILTRTSYDWAMSIVPLESVDLENRIAKTSVPATYPFSKLRTSAKEDVNNVWIENAIEFLNEPGQWVLNTKQRKLYIWPLDDKEPANIFAPQLTELIKIEGDIDYQGKTDVPVKNITFKGLTFTGAERFKWQKDKTGWGLQHDWEMFDRPTAMVRLRGAENCSIENCQFANSSGAGVRLDLYCQNNMIKNNLIRDIGGVGILLAGYGPGTKDVNKKNTVTNNYIHDIGQIYWQSLGIFVWQSGQNVVANNLIHNTPYTGIAVTGRIAWDRTGHGECSKTIRWHEVDKIIDPADKNISQVSYQQWQRRQEFLHARDNIIEKNEIRDVMEKLCDGNGIYISGAGKGNIARQNYIHHCPSTRMRESLRCDDDQYETTFEKNIVYKTGRRGINIKGKNKIINNIVADLRTDGTSSYLSFMAYPVDGALIERNIFYSEGKDQQPFNQSKAYNKTRPGPDLKTTKTDYNIYYNTKNPNWVANHFAQFRPVGIEVHSIFADPMFVDLEHENFLLKAQSPALKLGFQQIDVKEIGLTKDFPKEFLK